MSLKRKSIILILTFFCILSLFMCCFPLKAQAVEISPFSYYDPSPVTFKGTYNYYDNFDGNYMAFEAKAIASDGESHEIIITVYISNTNTTKQYRMYTDGVNRKADHIPIGNGGSYVSLKITFTDKSANITLDLKTYSWQQ